MENGLWLVHLILATLFSFYTRIKRQNSYSTLKAPANQGNYTCTLNNIKITLSQLIICINHIDYCPIKICVGFHIISRASGYNFRRNYKVIIHMTQEAIYFVSWTEQDGILPYMVILVVLTDTICPFYTCFLLYTRYYSDCVYDLSQLFVEWVSELFQIFIRHPTRIKIINRIFMDLLLDIFQILYNLSPKQCSCITDFDVCVCCINANLIIIKG